jgi:hypothetical protein
VNFLNVFEDRIGSIFGDSAAQAAPFSFKKLAKKAAHEMENETFVINGVDTAPALYTILVSSEDDQAMRPLYGSLTLETSQFIEAQASKRGYAFVGQPLVRFMVDPALRSGKFSIFAENVDVRTLNRLREEEIRFLGGDAAPAQQSQAAPSSAPIDAGLDAIPEAVVVDAFEDVLQENEQQRFQTIHPVQPVQPAQRAAGAIPVMPVAGAAAHGQSVPLAQNAEPKTQLRQPIRPQQPAPAPAPAVSPQRQAMLIDRTTGRTYTTPSELCIIGRERVPGGIVLRDPNISRRHAELKFTGVRWTITDLNSTNGTLVNDVDVDECVLHDGDLLTLGLTNLEFREG